MEMGKNTIQFSPGLMDKKMHSDRKPTKQQQWKHFSVHTLTAHTTGQKGCHDDETQAALRPYTAHFLWG